MAEYRKLTRNDLKVFETNATDFILEAMQYVGVTGKVSTGGHAILKGPTGATCSVPKSLSFRNAVTRKVRRDWETIKATTHLPDDDLASRVNAAVGNSAVGAAMKEAVTKRHDTGGKKKTAKKVAKKVTASEPSEPVSEPSTATDEPPKVDPRDTKECDKCFNRKPLDDFHKNASRKDGHQSTCKKCMNAYQRERYAIQRSHEKTEREREAVRAALDGEEPKKKTKKTAEAPVPKPPPAVDPVTGATLVPPAEPVALKPPPESKSRARRMAVVDGSSAEETLLQIKLLLWTPEERDRITALEQRIEELEGVIEDKDKEIERCEAETTKLRGSLEALRDLVGDL